MNLLSILLQAPATGGANPWSGLLMMVAIIAIFYFLMIRPQQKRQKDVQKAREALAVGDKVVTAGGIYGKIKEIGDVYMLIEIAEGVRIRIDKTSVFASTEDAKQK
ncbi:preprotein translocase subunit YajC [Parabacteroides sp. PFB2-10]|uniref:preprotein translocase subunit YajC n=1 Tax=Parabacteroides sp. PFB2-10 TaxID=1742405 RepID=UPI0024735EB4|nr:preprotein translocase subunit YajC [Parabacteroides sp. PFB2-10]MDH6311638.1 preprotein translocase subunit YajC [Parabacteroides sp. PFB2-10]MDL2208112.1 preprotein translocase subunit YajC [Parabacteroides sp. OttesenSCG-928-O15]MDL2245424.1 preprotein translocase subunit YajC [Parabacteroides sp. OttesenSCG-928-J18]